MQKKSFLTAYIFILVLVALRIIPYLFPESRTWGFNHLLFLPDSYSIPFFSVAFIALIIPFLRSSEKWGEALSDLFSTTFFISRLKYLYRIIFIAIMTALFIIFAAPTHFLGDGYPLLNNIASDTGTFIKWSERGVSWILLGVQSLIGPKNIDNALTAFRIISVASGIITIWIFFLIAEIAGSNDIKRFLIFIILTFSAVALLFFGYVESYPILWIGFSAFLYFSLKYMKTGQGLWWAFLFLLFDIFIHLQSFVLVPAFIYLLLCRGYGRNIYNHYKTWFIGSGIIIAAAILMIFIYKYSTDLYFENIFLPLFVGKPIYPVYSLISRPHLLDIANQLLLLSPLLPLLIVLSIKYISRTVRHKETIFLALSAVGSLIFLFIIDPKLTMARDWDLFSNSACALSILFIILIHDSALTTIKRLSISILILLIIFPLPYFLTNLNEKRSIEYIEYMIDLDLEKSFSSIFILNKYLLKHGYNEKADSLQDTYNKYPFPKSRYDWALAEIQDGNVEKAWSIFRGTIKDHFDQNYHVVLKDLYLREKNYAKALEHINKAIQLQSYADYLYGYRGEILLYIKRYNEALKDFYRAYELNSGDPNHPEGIAAVYFRKEQPDSGIFYTNIMLELDSTRAIGYYMLAQAYIKKKNFRKAQEYADRYAGFVYKDSTLLPFLKHILSSMKKAGGS